MNEAPSEDLKGPARRTAMKAYARDWIAQAIEDDIGGEAIMKEVWEHCITYADVAAVTQEMRQIVKYLRNVRTR